MSVRSTIVRAGRRLGTLLLRPFLLCLRLWRRLNSAQQLTLGFFSYVALGVLALSLPLARERPVGFLDNLFNVTSAMSTTGLTTVSPSDSYTFMGEMVLLLLFQLGGIGYMTVSSFIILARGRDLSPSRAGVMAAGFALPRGVELKQFIRHVVLFTVVIEAIGAALLYVEFSAAGVESPLWSAVFHSVSAFATAGFSLNNNSLESFRGNGIVCATVSVLSYLGAIGFIVIQDAWRALRSREHRITFTSKIILLLTAAVFVVGTPVLYFTDPSLAALPAVERFYAAAFQVMTASSTVGFNTTPIAQLSHASLTVIMIAMIIGASPSGTGGGIKTTTLSALLAVMGSVVRRRDQVVFFRQQVPMSRVLTAVASATLYLICLALGVALLCLVEKHAFLPLVFEATSGLGTVGLSMGITGDLTPAGKCIVTALMFIGRCGPLTLGLALLRPVPPAAAGESDLAV